MEIKAKGLKVGWAWKEWDRHRKKCLKDLEGGAGAEEGEEGKTMVSSQAAPAKHQGAVSSRVSPHCSFSAAL